jgi:hypothetical protein
VELVPYVILVTLIVQAIIKDTKEGLYLILVMENVRIGHFILLVIQGVIAKEFVNVVVVAIEIRQIMFSRQWIECEIG